MTSPRYGERPRLTTAEALSPRAAVHDGDDLGDAHATKWRRTTPANDDDGMDLTEVLVAEFSNPDLYRLAALVPEREVTSPGCPRDYPHWALMAFGHLASAYRSHRKVHIALRVPENWRIVLQTVEQTAGPEAVAALRPKARRAGPNRNHWNYWLKQHAGLWSELERAYTPMAVAQAVEQGLLDPDVPVIHASPDQRNTIYGDGKVMSSPVRHRPQYQQQGKAARRRDERPRRVDPASAFWQEGGDDGTDAFGTKLVFASVRGPGPLNRVCLTMGLQRKGGASEADHAVEQVARIVALAGRGVHAVAWDGALSHMHIDPIITRHGVVVISPVKAKSNPDGVRSGHPSDTRVEKEHHVKTIRHRANGLCEHSLHARGGRLGEKVLVSTGTASWQPLPIRRIERRQDRDSYRWYHLVDVPCTVNGTHQIRVPLVSSDDDAVKGFLRSEYLRQLPPDTKGYERAYGTRPSAESDNAQREERFTWRRLPAYGPDRQATAMLGWNFLENSKARYLHRRRAAAAEQQAAA